MGNTKIKDVLPQIIIKNWIPLCPQGNIFQNKLTFDCLREYTVLINKINILEQISQRTYEKNPYVCKVLFYYHLQGNTYKLYIQDFLSRITINNISEWKVHKKNIVQTFIHLSKIYGLTRVTPQMIGIDSKRQIKVWINPNVSLNQVWKPCKSESEMISDVLKICQDIEQKSQLAKQASLTSQKFLQKIMPISLKLKMKKYDNKYKKAKKQRYQNYQISSDRSNQKKCLSSSKIMLSSRVEQLNQIVSLTRIKKPNEALQSCNLRNSFYQKKKFLKSYNSEKQLTRFGSSLQNIENGQENNKMRNQVPCSSQSRNGKSMNMFFFGSEKNNCSSEFKNPTQSAKTFQPEKDSWKVQALVDVKLITVYEERESLHVTPRNSILEQKQIKNNQMLSQKAQYC